MRHCSPPQPQAGVHPEAPRRTEPLDDPATLPPVIRAIYDWLNFKARPVKTADFAAFLSSVKPVEAFDSFAELPDTFTLFQHISKMPENSVMTLKDSGPKHWALDMLHHQTFDGSTSELGINKDKLLCLLNHLLENSVLNMANLWERQDSYAVALSGGIDSGLMASFLRKLAPDILIHSYSIGSERCNEFNYARQCADFVGTEHKEILMDDKQFLEGLVNVIYFNEIYDSAFAEVCAPFHWLYQEAAKDAKLLLTGFGADMLLAGIVEPGFLHQYLNKKMALKLARTKWTGEFNPYLHEHHGIDVRHPFLSRPLIHLCKSLDPQFKVNGGCVKYILKELAEKLNLLPKEIIWREKVRLEDGMGNNGMFSQFLGLSTARSYKKKDIFTYEIFKLLFQERVPIAEIDLADIRNNVVSKGLIHV